METIVADGTMVRMGALPDENGGYVALLHQDWDEISEGDAGKARFDFGRDLFEGETRGIVEGEWFGVSIFFNNPKFLSNFELGNHVDIESQDGFGFRISLLGTRKAVRQVLKCQEELDFAE